MIKRNMGQVDRTVRLVAGAALFSIGAILLEGWQGNPAGALVSGFALLSIATGVTGFCLAYTPFGISTVHR